MKCFGGSARCPGGTPGSCAPGRDPTSISCSECLENLQPKGVECVECSGGDYVQLVFVALFVLVGTAALHLLLSLVYQSRGATQGRLIAAALCLNQLVTCAQLFSVMEQVQGINWTDPFASFLQIFHFLSLDTILDSLKSLSCVTRLSAEVNLLLRTLLVPLAFVVGPVGASGVMSMLPLLRNLGSRMALMKTCGFLALLFYITLCSTFLEPFRCNMHPSGVQTLQTNHAVFCSFSGTHLNMCVISGVVCLLPLSFLAICSYVLLVMLPRRVHQADAEFIRAFSFLIMRFKPGFEHFTVIFLVRNLIFVLTPIAPTAASLFIMGNLLIFSLVMSAYFKPWRSLAASQLDTMTTSILVIILLLSAFAADLEGSNEGIMILCTFCAALLITGVLVAAAYLALQHVASKLRKKYAFFLCHQRGSSSGFVRLMKMELTSRGFSAFIDADNLTDLSRLFSFVRSDTQTFVVVATPGVLQRMWCMGELAAAHLACVETLVLRFPSFEMPDDAFINSYDSIVPEIVELAVYGLGLREVQDALQWLRSVRQVTVDERFSMPHMVELADALSNSCASPSDSARMNSMDYADYIILADPGNLDAMASAVVLARYMVKVMPERGLSPCVFSEKDDVSKEHLNIVLLLTENCFRSEEFARWLLQARIPDAKVLPVIGDSRFQFPSGAEMISASRSTQVDQVTFTQVIKAILLEVALPFVCADSSQVDLMVRARQICRRLYGDLRPLSIKMLLAGPVLRESDANVDVELQLASETVAEAF